MKLISLILFTSASLGAAAQGYTYLPEDFESATFDAGTATVVANTGKWTVNKNKRSTEQKASGEYSLKFAQKAGVILPELAEGAGTLIYNGCVQNRQVTVEVSEDGSTWTPVESYKETTDWTKHSVSINNEAVRWVKIYTNSNNQFYIDDVLVTKPDGTDGEGNQIVCNLDIPYFIQDFEKTSQYPSSKDACTEETVFNVEGQGEWRYKDAYKGTNASYITDGSGHDLRMLKQTGYMISPILTQGVTKISFNEGRTGKKVTLYSSKDGGQTWNSVREIETDTFNEVRLDDKEINRIKLFNETTKGDIDVDNFAVYAFPEGTPATVSTGEVSNIKSSSATVSGQITAQGDRLITERGIVWAVGKTPDYTDTRVKGTGDKYNVTVTGLPAASEIHVRAYVLGLAGIGYGEEKTFRTLEAGAPTVKTLSLTADDFSDEKHIFIVAKGEIADNGGADVTEAGFVYGEAVSPTVAGMKATAPLYGTSFSTSLALQPSTKYYVRAYAINKAGTAYGEEMSIETPALEIPEYAHNVYYCDPEGDDATADGSKERPFFSLQKAADLVVPGDTIFMNAGTYKYNTRVNISAIGKPNSGMIALHSLGGRAVLDFVGQGLGSSNQGIRHTGSYWHYMGLDIINAGDNGLLIERNKPSGGTYTDIAANTAEGHDNVIELCNFVRNQDTGLQMKNLAEYNRVINCDSYYNTDPDHGDADGFAVKISHGTGNYFYGCRAWQNSDDGWDQFIKKEGGFPDDVTTTLEYCWAFENGILEDGSLSKGNGNGFKMGSNEGRNNVILNRCLAFDNVNKGFDQNHNTGSMILNNCSGYSSQDASNKSRYTYRLDEPVAQGKEIRFTNCTAISDGIADRSKSSYTVYSITGTQVTCDFNTLPEDYETISTAGMKGDRAEDGSLPFTGFLMPKAGSQKFVDKGSVVVPYPGESRYAEGIKFKGAAPDLGYYEIGGDSGIQPVLSLANKGDKLKGFVTASGELVVTVTGSAMEESHDVMISDLSGRIIYRSEFTGHTTTLPISAARGEILIVRVDKETLKLRIR